MKAIVTLDDDNSMLFNHRRQSRDRYVIDDICSLIDKDNCNNCCINKRDGDCNQVYDSKLYLTKYTAELFNLNDRTDIIVSDNPFGIAGENDYVFAETDGINKWYQDIMELIIYRWNRSYPGDTFFRIDQSDWELVETYEFKGHSHERITKDKFRRKRKKK